MKITIRILLVLLMLVAGVDLGIYLWPDYDTNDPGPPPALKMDMIMPLSCPPMPCMSVSSAGMRVKH